MEFGICLGPDRAVHAKNAGFDFFETSVGALLCPEADEAEFVRRLDAHRAVGLPFPAANVFLPGDLALIGPAVDRDRQLRYLDAAFARAGRAELRVIVFGSGRARGLPDGFDRAEGWGQLVAFGREAGRRAAAHGVTLAVEPLNRNETNVLNTLAETRRYVDEVASPAVRTLVDAFHWAREKETADVIADAGGRLAHVHVATRENRRSPGLEPEDFSEFFRGLRATGYDGRVSSEGGFDNLAAEAPVILAAMREAAGRSG